MNVVVRGIRIQNYVKHGIHFFSILLISLMVASCGILSSDDDDDPIGFEDGLSPQVRDMVDDELLAVLEDSLQVPVHRGDNPPDLEAILSGGALKGVTLEGVSVIMKPFIMLETVVPNDPCAGGGCTFWDLYLRMSSQDLVNYEIDIDMRHVEEPQHTGLGGYIIGEDNRFSIFAEQEQHREGEIVRSVNLFSGIVTSEGIEDPHVAIVMVDNAGFEDLIPDGSGRSFEDGNGFAELADWPEDQTPAKIDGTMQGGFWHLLLKDNE